ncbi:MAG: hypothetical protein COZ06_04190 [Armatimonadetes bacterium CG_4_10_14_3_um_filter_66_18]|nr:hypothetical protein [Armatimonadota bacterium]OIO94589.1 MAG: hypothetical protein AUJ96_28405 [Armatimonadetes bacterium CG2_30_66_41]PIU92738.1 MAG: hypothetical protein COS65_16280 [Armatimonadetes bacterium CG06_land_8_20_14_3_00_66_21]PIX39880.1 MAG: hypothetical protein COZ57_27265 [Armatimonadetes bacterium CG_4_8_14_3_um_filter_66_20]PIY51724.1 MAG: hypothetical protein COZ06_04190 [Armatimonadetes bacterium CG_4_10_14_3_um_filter_66_18]PJB63954.1 MAG: hypothetical protein CO096_20
MDTLRYLVDENIGPMLKDALLRQAPELTVWCVGDPGAPPLGTADPQILVWCEAKGSALVTNNRASMPVHLAAHLRHGGHVLGIFILNPGMTVGQTVEELVLIAVAADPEHYADRVNYLPVT